MLSKRCSTVVPPVPQHRAPTGHTGTSASRRSRSTGDGNIGVPPVTKMLDAPPRRTLQQLPLNQSPPQQLTNVSNTPLPRSAIDCLQSPKPKAQSPKP